jgi:hypothetical protein
VAVCIVYKVDVGISSTSDVECSFGVPAAVTCCLLKLPVRSATKKKCLQMQLVLSAPSVTALSAATWKYLSC